MLLTKKTASFMSIWSHKDDPHNSYSVEIKVSFSGGEPAQPGFKDLCIGQALAEVAERYLGCTLVKKEDG